jgi:Haem-degrading
VSFGCRPIRTGETDWGRGRNPASWPTGDRMAWPTTASDACFADLINKGSPATGDLPGVFASHGGLPIMVDDKVTGAVGVSGGAKAGVRRSEVGQDCSDVETVAITTPCTPFLIW